ncbi:hypothetical protein BDZ97DRAFT_1652494 [Flammula alnicola]|nr:hypothetical protein BDZ97DRAFT_1652494 [Flammula alnicola]
MPLASFASHPSHSYPNLTKKSRGRRVPTHATGNSDPDQKDQRLYVCQVEGCGKCFHRGEHLKRHIRSIHTHEKPFKCTFPLCQKYFNRHDNLLQHLKVHRDVIPKDDATLPRRSLPRIAHEVDLHHPCSTANALIHPLTSRNHL